MPCDQILQFPVDLKLCDKGMLAGTLDDMGIPFNRQGDSFYFQWNGCSASIIDGELTVRGMSETGTQEVAKEIKKAFTKRTIEVGAKKFGWTVHKTPVKNKIKIRHS